LAKPRAFAQGSLLKRNLVKIAKPWNLYFASTAPQGIARCASTDDMRSSLLWAASNSVPLAIRSGGHSYASFSATSGLLIDVSLVNEVAIHDAGGPVRMGRRAQRRCHASLRPINRAITHGRGMGVGVAGLVLGGGIGSARRH
jgi:FAD/FMN-containing dehydrogenase